MTTALTNIKTKVGAGALALVLAVAAPVVTYFEGLDQRAYLDPIGIPTICYGATTWQDGSKVKMGQRASTEQCKALLNYHLTLSYQDVTKCIGSSSYPHTFLGAMTSFTYNVGGSKFCSSTMARKAKAGDLQGACNELHRWNKAGGRVLNGLVKRRDAEYALCTKELKG